MLSGDQCKRSTPRVELDQRARDTRLGLERIERLLVRRTGPMRFRLRQTLHHLGAGLYGERPPRNPHPRAAEPIVMHGIPQPIGFPN
jgi:hypothetical protein